MKFAKYLFYGAGVYGLLTVLPLYVLEGRIALESPPAITHPEYFYGFVGVVVAWQLTFLMIGRQPQRLRPVMLGGIAEKVLFAGACIWLYSHGRIVSQTLAFGCVDLALAVLFLVAYLRTADPSGDRQRA